MGIFNVDGETWLADSPAKIPSDDREEVALDVGYEGWMWLVAVSSSDGRTDEYKVEYAGQLGDVLFIVGTELAVALALQGLEASWGGVNNVLTVSGKGNAIGDRTMAVKVYSPSGGGTLAWMVRSISHRRARQDALLAQFEEAWPPKEAVRL